MYLLPDQGDGTAGQRQNLNRRETMKVGSSAEKLPIAAGANASDSHQMHTVCIGNVISQTMLLHKEVHAYCLGIKHDFSCSSCP